MDGVLVELRSRIGKEALVRIDASSLEALLGDALTLLSGALEKRLEGLVQDGHANLWRKLQEVETVGRERTDDLDAKINDCVRVQETSATFLKNLAYNVGGIEEHRAESLCQEAHALRDDVTTDTEATPASEEVSTDGFQATTTTPAKQQVSTTDDVQATETTVEQQEVSTTEDDLQAQVLSAHRAYVQGEKELGEQVCQELDKELQDADGDTRAIEAALQSKLDDVTRKARAGRAAAIASLFVAEARRLAAEKRKAPEVEPTKKPSWNVLAGAVLRQVPSRRYSHLDELPPVDEEGLMETIQAKLQEQGQVLSELQKNWKVLSESSSSLQPPQHDVPGPPAPAPAEHEPAAAVTTTTVAPVAPAETKTAPLAERKTAPQPQPPVIPAETTTAVAAAEKKAKEMATMMSNLEAEMEAQSRALRNSLSSRVQEKRPERRKSVLTEHLKLTVAARLDLVEASLRDMTVALAETNAKHSEKLDAVLRDAYRTTRDVSTAVLQDDTSLSLSGLLTQVAGDVDEENIRESLLSTARALDRGETQSGLRKLIRALQTADLDDDPDDYALQNVHSHATAVAVALNIKTPDETTAPSKDNDEEEQKRQEEMDEKLESVRSCQNEAHARLEASVKQQLDDLAAAVERNRLSVEAAAEAKDAARVAAVTALGNMMAESNNQVDEVTDALAKLREEFQAQSKEASFQSFLKTKVDRIEFKKVVKKLQVLEEEHQQQQQHSQEVQKSGDEILLGKFRCLSCERPLSAGDVLGHHKDCHQIIGAFNTPATTSGKPKAHYAALPGRLAPPSYALLPPMRKPSNAPPHPSLLRAKAIEYGEVRFFPMTHSFIFYAQDPLWDRIVAGPTMDRSSAAAETARHSGPVRRRPHTALGIRR